MSGIGAIPGVAFLVTDRALLPVAAVSTIVLALYNTTLTQWRWIGGQGPYAEPFVAGRFLPGRTNIRRCFLCS